MKKQIIAAMIACAAAMSSAASFSWMQSSKQYAPDIVIGSIVAGHYDTSSSVNLNGWLSLTWAYTIELDNGTKTDTVSGTGLTYNMNRISMEDFASSDVMFKPAEGDPENVVKYSIIITADYTDTVGKKWTITSDAVVGTALFSDQSPLTLTPANFSGWTVTSAVPEPTSGLLLLLGVAGLALKRKKV